MPGIENAAPDRTDTSNGFFASPNFLPTFFSISARAATTCSHMPSGNCLSLVVKSVAGFGGHDEPRRNGQAGAGHLAEAGAFAAEERFVIAVAFFE